MRRTASLLTTSFVGRLDEGMTKWGDGLWTLEISGPCARPAAASENSERPGRQHRRCPSRSATAAP